MPIITRTLNDKEKATLEKLCNRVIKANDNAEKQITDFFTKAQAKVIAVDNVETQELMNRYFEVCPPFAEKKRHEFPDAVALLSLEKWAKRNEKYILAVSKDGDWKKFAEQSNWIDIVESLPEALGKLLQISEAVKERVDQIIRDVENGVYPEIRRKIADKLHMFDWIENVNIEANSEFAYENHETDLNYVDHRLLDAEDNVNFFISKTDDDNYEVSIQLMVDVELDAKYDFFVEDISIGSTAIRDSYTIPITLLVNLLDEGESISIHNISVYPAGNIDIDVGDIGPDFDDFDNGEDAYRDM